jgi:hypothetical protein
MLMYVYQLQLNLSFLATNKSVEEWNARVQDLNPSEPFVLKSNDRIMDMDDPNGYLKSMITEHVLNCFYQPGSNPPHELKLKVNDICLLTRHVNRKKGLTNNCRVQIVRITNKVIRVKSLHSNPPVFENVPRYRFPISLPYGYSYKMMRTQFPLRLAYALSLNKAQGQEFAQVACDISIAPFAHGHLYVGLSRIRKASSICLYATPEQMEEDSTTHEMGVTTYNVIYPSILSAVT